MFNKNRGREGSSSMEPEVMQGGAKPRKPLALRTLVWAGTGMLIAGSQLSLAAVTVPFTYMNPATGQVNGVQTWQVPAGVTKIKVTVVGGGGGGGGSSKRADNNGQRRSGGAGGQGAKVEVANLDVSGLTSISLNIGKGGNGSGGSGTYEVGGGGGGGGSTWVGLGGTRQIVAGGGGGGAGGRSTGGGGSANGTMGGSGCFVSASGAGGDGVKVNSSAFGAAPPGGGGGTNPLGLTAGGTGGMGNAQGTNATGGNGGGGTNVFDGRNATFLGSGGGGGGYGGGGAAQGGTSQASGAAGGSAIPTGAGVTASCTQASNSGAGGDAGTGSAPVSSGSQGTSGSVTIEYDDVGTQEISCKTDSVSYDWGTPAFAPAIPEVTATPTATASGAITFAQSSDADNVCSLNGTTGLLTPSGAGSCKYVVNVAAITSGSTTTHGANSKTCSIPVNKASPNLSVQLTAPVLPGVLTMDGPGALGASWNAGATGAVTFHNAALGAGQTAACSVDENTGALTVLHSTEINSAYVCGVYAHKNADGNFVEATTAVLSLPIARAKVSLAASGPTAVVVGGNYSFSASSLDNKAGAITITASGGGCTYANGLITGVAAGTNNCVISASAAGTDDYIADPISLTFSVGKGTPVLSWPNPLPAISLKVNGSSQTLTASSNPVAGAISYAASGGKCSVDPASGAITALHAGTCTITASQAETDNYLAATSITQDLTVAKDSQTIEWVTPLTSTMAVAATGKFQTAQVKAGTNSAAGTTIAYSTTTTDVCLIDASTGALTAKKAGSCQIKATKAGDADYDEASIDMPITVGLATPDLSWVDADMPASLSMGDTGKSVKAKSTVDVAVAGAIQYTSDTTGVCTVNGTLGAITLVAAGSCTIKASLPAKADYTNAATPITWTKEVGKIAQNLTFSVTPAVRDFVKGSTFSIAGTATSDHTATGYAIKYTSKTPLVCTVAATTVTMVGAGDCTIAANQDGDATYAAATEQTQTVKLKASKSFTGTTVPAPGVAAGQATVEISGGGDNCGFDLSGSNTAFVAASGPLPTGKKSAQGQLKFKLLSCEPGGIVTVKVTWPQAPGSLLKFGKASAGADPTVYAIDGLVVDKQAKTTTYTLKDGAKGDDDWLENGEIVDPVIELQADPVPAGGAGTALAVPFLNFGGLALLSLMAAVMGALGVRRSKQA